MEPEARYVWVGAAVLALSALLAAGIYWLTGGGADTAAKRYTIYFHRQSLEGLQVDSQVRMQGIKVGRVADYAILPNQGGTVRVLLEVDEQAPVMEGVMAVIARNLVTGLAAVDLKNPGKESPPLAQIPPGERYPVIPEGTPQFAHVTSTLEELSQLSRESLTRLNALLSERNQAEFAATLTNVRAVSGEAARVLPELAPTLASARAAANQLQVVGTTATHTLERVETDISRLTDATDKTLGLARTTLEGLDQHLTLSSDLALQELQATGRSLRDTGMEVRAASQALQAPRQLLLGPTDAELGPGEENR